VDVLACTLDGSQAKRERSIAFGGNPDINPDINSGGSARTVASNPTTHIPMISGGAHCGEQWRTSSYHTGYQTRRVGQRKRSRVWMVCQQNRQQTK
jgi:hypothetical protein